MLPVEYFEEILIFIRMTSDRNRDKLACVKCVFLFIQSKITMLIVLERQSSDLYQLTKRNGFNNY